MKPKGKQVTKYLILILCFICSIALADEAYYGSDGSYQGNSYSYDDYEGTTTDYYGADGSYEGTAYSSGDITDYYGSSGDYQGTSYREDE